MSFDRLGPYRILSKLGRGGMGMVLLGKDETDNHTAAIKLLAGDMAANADFRERFKAEIETLRKLNHPNIVQIYGYGEQDAQIFYAMEYVSGGSLEAQLNLGRAFTWREVAQFGVEIARALRHAHDRGVIHRDIKPGNLLVADDGSLKLSDFGIARLFWKSRITGAGSVLGTAEFMAAEQAEGRAIDSRSDLYSLGAVLYVLLARRPLFQARSLMEMIAKQRSEKPPPLRSVAADVPVEFEQIIHRLLEKDPERRFATATAVERRLESMLESLRIEPAAKTQLMVDPAAESLSLALDVRPVSPLAVTVAATHQLETPPSELESPDAGLPEQPSAVEAERAAVVPEESTERPAAPDAADVSPSARFVAVRPGELDVVHHQRPEVPWISWQTWVLITSLLGLGMLAWYLLQPPSADALYRRIERQKASDSADALAQSENDIRLFLERFPRDPRREELNEDMEKIELSRLETRLDHAVRGMSPQIPLRPLERRYVEAMNAAHFDIDLGVEKLQAMVGLFEPGQEKSGPEWRCLQLAKRRLEELGKQAEAAHKEQLVAVARRLDLADELSAADPQAAAGIRRAAIVLYQGKPWAKELVDRARTGLEKR